ncbi:MAG: MFS transporter, partial [Terriglobales bacterium]
MSDPTATQANAVPAADVFPSQQPITPGWRLSFWALIVTQFQGAFSANVLRYLLTFMVLGLVGDETHRNSLSSLITALFFIPLVLFSMAGGFLADRFSKRGVTIATKLIEIVAMVVAIFALTAAQQQRLVQVGDLWRDPKLLLTHFPLPLVVLFVVATQAALFGPAKYGLLPELLPEKWLSWGNGIIEMGTFLAIISGAMAAGWIAQTFQGREQYAGWILVVLAVLGCGSSLFIAKVPAAAPQKTFKPNFVAELWKEMKAMRPDRPLWLAVLGNTFFWFLGALFLQTIVVYGKNVLNLNPTRIGLLEVALMLGIGAGSVLAGYLSGNK